MKIRDFFPHVILAVFLVGMSLLLYAGQTGKITGIVTDKNTGQPLVGVSVQIEGTTLIAKTDPNGEFVILSVPPGKYRLRLTIIGYEILVLKEIEVLADSVADFSLQLAPTVTDTGRVTIVGETRKAIDMGKIECSDLREQSNDVGHPGIKGVESGGSRSKASSSDRYSGTSFHELECRPHPRPVPPPPHFPYGGSANVNGAPFDGMFFKNYGVNPFVDTEDDHLSTFAIDVDDASYILTRSYLDRGYLPPEDAIRVEEFINHFDYEYETPGKAPFEVYIDGAPSYFGQNCELLRIGIKGRGIGRCQRQPATLIFLIDVSGSMAREDRLGLVKDALMYLVDQLDASDRIGIVAYESSAREILEPVSVRNRGEIHRAISCLQPGGSTNLDHGLNLAYRMAERNFLENRINRVILCSDGVANVGATSADELLRRIKRFSDMGITLTAVGVGMGNHNDALLEQLGDKGNGQYAYVDGIEEARRLFVEKLAGTLQIIARDVKIQVDFNPRVVRSYRLLGYENRNVEDDKFRDDREDGGEIGAEHQVTALYEIKLHNHAKGGLLGRVNIRYKDPEGYETDEIHCDVQRGVLNRRFENASPQLQLAAAAAEFAEILKRSYWARGSSLQEVYRVASRVSNHFRSPEVDEFLKLIREAESYEDARADRDW